MAMKLLLDDGVFRKSPDVGTVRRNQLICLVDRVNDPMEKWSLAESVQHRVIRKKLRSSLASWMRETGDYLPAP